MFRNLVKKVAFFSYVCRPSHVWSAVCFKWHCMERGQLWFLAGILLAFSVIAVIISQSVIGQQVSRDINCLALNVYNEARGEPRKGKLAVAVVTLNRVASSLYPDSVCEVVYQKRWDYLRKRYVSAFSWTELDNTPSLNSKAWKEANQIAQEIYFDKDRPMLDQALFYHAEHIRPSWARTRTRVAKIGRHIFYN